MPPPARIGTSTCETPHPTTAAARIPRSLDPAYSVSTLPPTGTGARRRLAGIDTLEFALTVALTPRQCARAVADPCRYGRRHAWAAWVAAFGPPDESGAPSEPPTTRVWPPCAPSDRPCCSGSSGRIARHEWDPTPAAAPVAPGARIAVEHALSSESFDAYTDTRDAAPVSRMPVVPPDGRPVVVFNRPVRDLGQVGSPSVPGSPAAEAVGPAAFSYRLGHVVLVRTDGGDRVVAAAGVAHVGAAGVVTLPGAPGLPRAGGAVAGRCVAVAVTAVGVHGVARAARRAGGRRPTGWVGPGGGRREHHRGGPGDRRLSTSRWRCARGGGRRLRRRRLTAGGVRYRWRTAAPPSPCAPPARCRPRRRPLEAPEPARLEGRGCSPTRRPGAHQADAPCTHAVPAHRARAQRDGGLAACARLCLWPHTAGRPICVRFDDVPPALGKETRSSA